MVCFINNSNLTFLDDDKLLLLEMKKMKKILIDQNCASTSKTPIRYSLFWLKLLWIGGTSFQ
jgi:hypothetical protein